MVAMLDALQSAAAACTLVCVERLQTLYEEQRRLALISDKDDVDSACRGDIIYFLKRHFVHAIVKLRFSLQFQA